MREGLAAVISIQELLTDQILLFNFETVAVPWLQYVRLLFCMASVCKTTILDGAVLRLHIKQAVNNEIC